MDLRVRVCYLRLEAPLGWLFYLTDFMREVLSVFNKTLRVFMTSLKPSTFISDLEHFVSQPQYSSAPHYRDSYAYVFRQCIISDISGLSGSVATSTVVRPTKDKPAHSAVRPTF